MVSFGQAIHTRLQILDDQGQAYQLRVNDGIPLDVIDHDQEWISVTREGEPISRTIYINLARCQTLEIIEI